MDEACEDVVRHYGPDLIHIHGTENPFGLIGPRSSVPVLISLQGLLTVYERFYFRGKTAQEVARMALTRDFVMGRSAIQGYWRCVRMAVREREIMRGNRSFTGRTEWDRTVLWAVNPSADYHHCDEVLRAPFYRCVWRPEAAAARTIFCTSNTVTWKAAESLIEALGLLHRAGYGDVRLRIAGIPPASGIYAQRARRHGVAGSVDWLGRLDAEQLAEELLRATVFAYPSHIDNSPNALCEALLVGVPTVASYIGGIPSLMKDGSEGLLYPDDDTYTLAGRIRRLLDDPSSAAEAGRKARERASRRHDPEAIVARLLSIYGELLS